METTNAGAGRSRGDAPESAVLFVLLASAAFATSSPLARLARPVHPLTVAFGRVAVAGALLIALDVPGAVLAVRRMTGRQRATVLAAGVLLAAHFGLFLWGLDRTSLPAAVSLISLEPLAVVVCAWALFGIRPSRREQVGLLFATSGALVISSTAGVGEHRLDGDLLVIGSVVLFGFYVSVARALRDALPARTYAALVYAGAALTLGCALPLTPGAMENALPPSARAGAAIVALGLIPTVIGHTAVQSAARRLSPSIVALVSPGETLGGIAIGAALLGALPTTAELVGAAIILAGSTIAITGASGGMIPPSSGEGSGASGARADDAVSLSPSPSPSASLDAGVFSAGTIGAEVDTIAPGAGPGASETADHPPKETPQGIPRRGQR